LQTFWKNHQSGNYSIESYPWNTTTDRLAGTENLTMAKARHPAGNNNPSFNVFHTDLQSVVDKLKNSGFVFLNILKLLFNILHFSTGFQKQLIWI
jgi:hypothetical protein